MRTRLLLDNEAKEIGHQLWLVGDDLERRLKGLHEDGHHNAESTKKAATESFKLLVLIDVLTQHVVLREMKWMYEPLDCDCHRYATVEEAHAITQSLDNYSDKIISFFDLSKGANFSYNEQLAREAFRVGVDDGNCYMGWDKPSTSSNPAEASSTY